MAYKTTLTISATVLMTSLALGACSTPFRTDAETAEQTLLEDGRRIARIECSSCHAIGTTGVSPNPQSPPLRYVLNDYNPRALEVDLVEGIRVGHNDMPVFELSPIGVRSLTAYLKSIQVEDS